MPYQPVHKHVYLVLLFFALTITACSDEAPQDKTAEQTSKEIAEPVDIVATVGDETITYGELNSMLNSSAMVGVSIPSLGTPERNQMMLALLENAINANLIYLDAKQEGSDRLTSYTEDVHRFEDAILASMYQSKLMLGDTRVSELEVLHYYNTQTSKEAELNDNLKLAIETMLRKQKMDEFESTLRERLRENVKVVINEKVLASEYDDKRSDADVVASYDNHRISWNQVKGIMVNANRGASPADYYVRMNEERITRLQQFIDNAIMAFKARAAGLENDPVFIKRSTEYRKARLINEHRNGLIHRWNPSDDELKSYMNENKDKFVIPEARRVQMVIVKTREEAESIKAQIDDGEITFGQAAQQYSIDPNAKHTQGDMGWVSQNKGLEGIGELIFKLEPDIVSEPVESHAGWHLVKLLAVIEAQVGSLDDPQTRESVFRAYMQDKMNHYISQLRNKHFKVEVYQDELDRQFQREADFINELNSKAQQESSIKQQRIEEMQQWVNQPTQ